MKFLINIDIFITHWVKNAIKTEFLSKNLEQSDDFFLNAGNLNCNCCGFSSVQFKIRARKWPENTEISQK